MSDHPPPTIDSEVQGTTQAAGQSIDEGKGRIFPCSRCGADFKFHIGQQQLKCPFCGHEELIEFADDAQIVEQDFQEILARLRIQREKERPEEPPQNEIRCDACGGNVLFVGPLTSTDCPYCGSPVQRDKVHVAGHRIPVDGVLPFLIEKKHAQSNLKTWVNSRWFAPGDFRSRGVDGKFNGVYLPFWTFDSLTYTSFRGERGEHYYVTVGTGKDQRQERRTRWYPASGRFQRFFDDVLVLAARGLNHGLMLKLEPWPLGRCTPFNQEMLAGYLARTYEVEVDDGFVDAKGRIEAAIAAEVRGRIGGDEQRVHAINTHFGALTFKHLLLPVWLLAYRYRDKTFQVMVNAATGEVQGERPYSWVKIALAVIAGLAAAAGIALLFANA